MKTYQKLATQLNRRENCINRPACKHNFDDAEEKIDSLMFLFPSGSGFDGKTKINYELSKDDKIVINSEYHCMSENGFYCGWITFRAIITPSLQFGYNMRLVGNFSEMERKEGVYGMKEYISDTFNDILSLDID